MDILTYFLALFISILIVTPTCFYLFKCHSYIKISLIVVVLYLIILGGVYLVEWRMSSKKSNNTSTTITTTPLTIIPSANIPDSGNELPFDGLPPSDLLKNMQYLYKETSNPLHVPSQMNTLTSADVTLNKDRKISNSVDGTLVDGNDAKYMSSYLSYAGKYYPNLTLNQVDTRDCLNDMGANSCFQSAKMFEKTNSILDKGITKQNADVIVREDFVNFAEPSSVNLYSSKPFFDGNQRKLYDSTEPIFMNAPMNINSNDNIENNMCHGCKIGVCVGDYCATANQLFN